MRWYSAAVALMVLAASCAAPERPDEWTVAREAPSAEAEDPGADVCDDIRALVLGSQAGERGIDGTLEELARIGAIVGAAQRPAVTDEAARRGWIPSSALAWTLGLVLGLFVEQFVPSDAGVGFSLAASALGGALVGAAVGGVLGARIRR